MTAPFTSQLRARGDALNLAPAGAGSITVRVETPETWDTVKAVVSPSQTVAELKQAVIAELFPVGRSASDFVLKLRGWEVLDENVALSVSGARDGSIFLLTLRHRRAVR